jgi:glycine/serine hydroxymethyltransferase
MEKIAAWIVQVLDAPADQAVRGSVRAQVTDLCRAFPLYQELVAAG